MSNRFFSGPHDERSILRQLKVLVAILVLSNVALGVFGEARSGYPDVEWRELLKVIPSNLWNTN
jgi:hypothetical protein